MKNTHVIFLVHMPFLITTKHHLQMQVIENVLDWGDAAPLAEPWELVLPLLSD
jgi:hypothetical protein